MCSISIARSDSAATNSFVASFAVLLFEPQTTIPPNNNETAAAMRPRSDWITTDLHSGQNNSPSSYGDPGGEDEFAAALNLGGKLFDMLIEDNLLVGITKRLISAAGLGIALRAPSQTGSA